MGIIGFIERIRDTRLPAPLSNLCAKVRRIPRRSRERYPADAHTAQNDALPSVVRRWFRPVLDGSRTLDCLKHSIREPLESGLNRSLALSEWRPDYAAVDAEGGAVRGGTERAADEGDERRDFVGRGEAFQ